MTDLSYADTLIQRILASTRTIAVVGASANADRPSHEVMHFLQNKGYRVIPVNPGLAGKTLLGEEVYASLTDIPGTIDMVDIFRASDAVPPIVDEAILIGARTVWMQLGVRHDEAAAKAEGSGLTVVMNRCPKIELLRLAGQKH